MAQTKVKQAAEFGFEMEQTVIYIAVGDLNDAGNVALERYREANGSVPIFKVNGVETEHLPIGVAFPYPEGGIEQHLDPAFLEAWRAEWNSQVMARGIKVDLNIDKFVKGQARIDLNRDRTPVAYEKFGVAKGEKKGKSKTAAKPVGVQL